MSRLDQIRDGLLRQVNPYACIILGMLTSAWGLWLLAPWETFTSAPVFSKLAQFVPEPMMGLWSLVCGLLIIGAVFRGLYKCLYLALGFAVWHWGTVSVLMWWGDWHNTGGLTYGFICLYCIYLYLNIKVNYSRYGEDIPNFYS